MSTPPKSESPTEADKIVADLEMLFGSPTADELATASTNRIMTHIGAALAKYNINLRKRERRVLAATVATFSAERFGLLERLEMEEASSKTAGDLFEPDAECAVCSKRVPISTLSSHLCLPRAKSQWDECEVCRASGCLSSACLASTVSS